MSTDAEKKEKRTKIVGAALAAPPPQYQANMVHEKGFLVDVAIIAVTGVLCYVGINLLRGKSFDEIKDKVEGELKD
jgi:hypothetical protein